jgi:hypothetical protein
MARLLTEIVVTAERRLMFTTRNLYVKKAVGVMMDTLQPGIPIVCFQHQTRSGLFDERYPTPYQFFAMLV